MKTTKIIIFYICHKRRFRILNFLGGKIYEQFFRYRLFFEAFMWRICFLVILLLLIFTQRKYQFTLSFLAHPRFPEKISQLQTSSIENLFCIFSAGSKITTFGFWPILSFFFSIFYEDSKSSEIRISITSIEFNCQSCVKWNSEVLLCSMCVNIKTWNRSLPIFTLFLGPKKGSHDSELSFSLIFYFCRPNRIF